MIYFFKEYQNFIWLKSLTNPLKLSGTAFVTYFFLKKINVAEYLIF